MKRPKLREVPINTTLVGPEAVPSVNIFMDWGCWDAFLQMAYDRGYNLIEADMGKGIALTYRKWDSPAQILKAGETGSRVR